MEREKSLRSILGLDGAVEIEENRRAGGKENKTF